MTAGKPFLPYGRHQIDDQDIAAVSRVLAGDFLTTGPIRDDFERAFAAKTGARYAVSCSSGTAALHIAALALGLGEGDAVVVPTITFLATANAARYVGAEVIFADVDPDTGLMTTETLDQALNLARQRNDGKKARAVIPVHLAGQCAPMGEIAAMAAGRGLDVVDDACHAVGATYRESNQTATVGDCRHSRMSVFSFHPVKTIAMGEGGAVTTNDAELYEALKLHSRHGMVRDADKFENTELAFDPGGEANPWYYEMPRIGYNYRASDINCALGLSQLGKLEDFIERRRVLMERYEELLAPLAPLVRPLARVPYCQAAWHLNVVLIDFASAGVTRAKVMDRLGQKGIGSQVHYIPVHRQPYYRRRYGDILLAGADRYYGRTLSLPLFSAMADEDVERVVEALKGALG